MSQLPYLSGSERSTFDAWVEESWARYVPPLTFSEVRKGVQALLRLREEGTREEGVLRRAYEGMGKRAASATYLAWLHYLSVFHACEMLGLAGFGPLRRIWDLGCGSGAVGSALARALPGEPEVVGIDRSGWALGEARETWSLLGVRGRARRETLPDALPFAGRGELLALGWILGELDEGGRRRLLGRASSALGRGTSLLVLEDLTPEPSWWRDLLDRLEPGGAEEQPLRVSIERPKRIRAMDKAARRDHQVLALRAIVVPPASSRRSAP